MTVAEMYLASCAPEPQERQCEACGQNTRHECQSRMYSPPNVLVVQVRRGPGDRVGVAVEQELDVLGLPTMALARVVYHNGADLQSGHYTCVCRGPGGRFWYYDDAKAVVRMDMDVAHIKPKQVYMAVYCRGDGSASWQQRAAESGVVVVDADSGGDAGGAGGALVRLGPGAANGSAVGAEAGRAAGDVPA